VTILSAIVVDYRGGPLLRRCLADLSVALAQLAEPSELIVVDNSGDLTGVPDGRLVSMPCNRGFAGGAVAGIAEARGEWIALVNNDAFLAPDCLVRMLAAGRGTARVGSVAPQIRFDGRRDLLNSAGLEVDVLGIGSDRLAGRSIDHPAVWKPVEVFGASACVALYRRTMLDAVGGFDPSFFAYQEDADVAWRARMAGWLCMYEPHALAWHRGSATAREATNFKYRLVGRNRVRMIAKNASPGQLRRHAAGILIYDLAYVGFVAVADRSLAPLRGRLRGLREWRRYRRAGAPGRRAVTLCRSGWRAALRQRAAYRVAAPATPPPDREPPRA
jgi:GT2 family glycosyltransferase